MQTLINKQIAQENVMHCPLCGMPQEGIVKGTITNGSVLEIQQDKFYAFCNCHNIFFTAWSNMKQEVYNEDYQKKYNGPVLNPDVYKHAKDMFDLVTVSSGKFAEVGVVTDEMLDYAKQKGFEPVAIDINPTTKTKYDLIIGSLDDLELPKADVYWLSHVLEHVRDPILVMQKVFDSLNVGGCVYVSMPDPWFIPWESPNLWAHWHCHEHHIMWDMDSFIDTCISLGFELSFSKRRSFGADYHIIMKRAK
jgi:SAM-dependent methyltransferase